MTPTGRPLPNSDQLGAGAVVRVPFPYSDGQTAQFRPALVVGRPNALLVWVVMITSAANRPWPGDVPIPAGQATGLPVMSIIRTAKIATVDADKLQVRGQAPVTELRLVLAQIRETLGLSE
jgi:mRNA interferase MazF